MCMATVALAGAGAWCTPTTTAYGLLAIIHRPAQLTAALILRQANGRGVLMRLGLTRLPSRLAVQQLPTLPGEHRPLAPASSEEAPAAAATALCSYAGAAGADICTCRLATS